MNLSFDPGNFRRIVPPVEDNASIDARSIRMAVIAAGFNRVSAVADLSDRVITGGLANCIAVVGIDRALGGMRIAHYDTVNCHNGDRFTPGPLIRFRDWFGNDSLTYIVGLGGLWFNAFPDSRHHLIMSIVEAFGFEPRIAKAVLSVRDAGGNNFIMQGHDNEALLPTSWSTMGAEIPYANLR